MRIHMIAMGGSVMHNLALALYYNHHTVSGSDDEIYNPARDRLFKAGLLPDKEGWFPEQIDESIDLVILGMHARPDNPELARAIELKIPVYSFPEYIYQHSKDKLRIVVAGSHGKTSTTSMIMHILQYIDHSKYDQDLRFDYLVGAQLEGFERMVQLSDAPIMVIEGDEYLSSPIDRRPKFLHYKPHISIITGIAWDHINVFPTFESYVEQFELFFESLSEEAKVFYYQYDENLARISNEQTKLKPKPYIGFNALVIDGETKLLTPENEKVALNIFGKHNLENLKATYLVCKELGIEDEDIFKAMSTFTGAAKRLQLLRSETNCLAYLDFAHAPSKVKATVNALKQQYPERQLVAVVELHTFSSLNKQFLPHYEGAMDLADEAIVYFSEHTLKMKKLPEINDTDIIKAFKHPNLKVFKHNQDLSNYLKSQFWSDNNLLMMTSGTFNNLDLKVLANQLIL